MYIGRDGTAQYTLGSPSESLVCSQTAEWPRHANTHTENQESAQDACPWVGTKPVLPTNPPNVEAAAVYWVAIFGCHGTR